MKKTAKKLSALLLALMMLMAAAVPALAANEDTSSIPIKEWKNITGDTSVTLENKSNDKVSCFQFTSHKQLNDARFEQVFEDVAPGAYSTILLWATKGVTAELTVNGQKLTLPDVNSENAYRMSTLDINIPTQRDVHIVVRFKGVGVSTLFGPNFARQGDAAPAPVPAENLLTNPGFESGLTGWTADAGHVRYDAYTSLTGFSSAALTYPTHTGMENGLSQTVSAQAGSYTGSVSVYTETALNGVGAMVLLEAKDKNGTVLATAVSPTVSDTKSAWQEISATIDAPAGTAQITMKAGGLYCMGSFHLDEAQLVKNA